MTADAKTLLERLEKAKAELDADPKGYEQRLRHNKEKATDEIIDVLNKLNEFIKDVEENPANFEEAEKLKAALVSEIDFFTELYKSCTYELPSSEEVEAAIEETKKQVTAGEAEGYIAITGEEYTNLIHGAIDGNAEAIDRLKAYHIDYEDDAELEKQARQTNKELLTVLSGDKRPEAEALLITATLEDYEAAGITLSTWQRDIILSGATEKIKGIIYDLLLTQLLKLWQVLTDGREDQPGSLQLTPYSLNKPKTTAISVSKAANLIVKIAEQGENGTIIGVGHKGKDVVEISAIMKYDDKNITLLGRPLTEFDKTVHDAAAAIYAAGNKAFTVLDLYRACNGNDIETIKADTIAPYIESVEQSITRRLRIDATDQIQAYYKGKVKKVVYENYFLPLKAVEITMNNGETVKGYAFLDAPPLYEYSSNIRQVVSAPVGLLRAGKTIRQTPEVATITRYLIQRIDGIKNPKNALQNKIAYDAIFTAAGIDTSKLDRTQLKRKRDIVKAKLDYFKLQGFIADYLEYKNGRQAGGIEIIAKV